RPPGGSRRPGSAHQRPEGHDGRWACGLRGGLDRTRRGAQAGPRPDRLPADRRDRRGRSDWNSPAAAGGKAHLPHPGGQRRRAVRRSGGRGKRVHPQVADGGTLFTPRTIAQLLNTRREVETQLERLTAREKEVLRLMAEGTSSREIANKLGISYTTVRTHIRSLGSKLGVHSKLEAIVKARELALVE